MSALGCKSMLSLQWAAAATWRREAINYLNAKGEKYGLIRFAFTVRLALSAFVDAIPASAKGGCGP